MANNRWVCTATLLAVLAVGAGAFTTPARYNERRISGKVQNIDERNAAAAAVRVSINKPVGSTTSTSALLMAAKKKPEAREKIENPLELLILYATPWKNPNSIFVYLFVLVYCLGKYSESQSALQ